MNLHATRTVYYVDKGGFPMAAAGRDPSRYPVLVLSLFSSRQFRVIGAHVGDRHHARERMRKGIDPLLTETVELDTPVVGQRSIFVIFSLRWGPRGTGTETMSPRFLPISALPTGDSLESFISDGLASADPTILYFTDFSVFWSFTCTTE